MVRYLHMVVDNCCCAFQGSANDGPLYKLRHKFPCLGLWFILNPLKRILLFFCIYTCHISLLIHLPSKNCMIGNILTHSVCFDAVWLSLYCFDLVWSLGLSCERFTCCLVVALVSVCCVLV
ncbi:hypothetical protein E2542_SST17930 [Spatholobus suberectus]|nr:hypothetical protein E2542_SST17930 [Spatholobus suberectus]